MLSSCAWMVNTHLWVLIGIIIDAFKKIRDDKAELEEDIKAHCFVCNLDRFRVDQHGIGFDKHIKTEHNPRWVHPKILVLSALNDIVKRCQSAISGSCTLWLDSQIVDPDLQNRWYLFFLMYLRTASNSDLSGQMRYVKQQVWPTRGRPSFHWLPREMTLTIKDDGDEDDHLTQVLLFLLPNFVLNFSHWEWSPELGSGVGRWSYWDFKTSKHLMSSALTCSEDVSVT